jgi:hypothetical protein
MLDNDKARCVPLLHTWEQNTPTPYPGHRHGGASSRRRRRGAQFRCLCPQRSATPATVPPSQYIPALASCPLTMREPPLQRR